MIRRIFLLLPILLLPIAGLPLQANAQEELPVANSPEVRASGMLTVVQWVKPRTAGVVKGEITTPIPGGAAALVDNAVVELRGKDGWMGSGETNRLGRFTITDVRPGPYSMVVRGPGVFACYALHVAGENEDDTHVYPERVRVSCTVIGEEAIGQLLFENMGEYTINDVEMAVEGPVSEKLIQDKVAAVTTVVELIEGKLAGTLYEAGSAFDPAVSQKVTLIKDGLVVGRTITDATGSFEIAGLDAGIHGLVTNGPDGVGVVGIELIAAKVKDGQASNSANSQRRFVSMVQGGDATGQFYMQIVPQTFGEIAEDCDTCEPLACSCCPLPLGTGGGGGGGGGGIGGGALAVAALAAAAATATSGDGSAIIASPATTD